MLSLARSLGEFGAVKVVSGNVTGETQTATLVVEQKYQNFEQADGLRRSSFLLALAARGLPRRRRRLLRPKRASRRHSMSIESHGRHQDGSATSSPSTTSP